MKAGLFLSNRSTVFTVIKSIIIIINQISKQRPEQFILPRNPSSDFISVLGVGSPEEVVVRSFERSAI